MESDDEWITEIEDTCLPQYNSWMDIHECFDDEELGIGTSKKRKRGPRNLQFDVKKKGKAILQEEDIQTIGNEEVHLQDEDDENLIVLGEDEDIHDDNDLELGDGNDDLELEDDTY
ncbi:hypothetical protein REPUB_Repub09cG0154400 [Reevesia pubescens]